MTTTKLETTDRASERRGDAHDTHTSPAPWPARCVKCETTFAAPPPLWECPSCKGKTWQPDNDSRFCSVCHNTITLLGRQHCLRCGRLTCKACTQSTMVIPEWSLKVKHYVCTRCVTPLVPVSICGYLQKLSHHNFSGDAFQRRFCELRGSSLKYSVNEGDSAARGVLELAQASAADAPQYLHAFCVWGPNLPREYVFCAADKDEKARWLSALRAAILAAAVPKPIDTGGGATGDMQRPQEVTTLLPIGPLRDKYESISQLGTGSFGTVIKVRDRGTNQIYALKMLEKSKVTTKKMVLRVNEEHDILRHVVHPFICRMHDSMETAQHVVFVLEFLSGGELFYHLRKSRRFSESRARHYAAEIGLALEHIHELRIVYRDLKPENLVLNSEGHVVLTDFGLAKMNVVDHTNTFCGTPQYIAPEMIRRQPHTKAVDWWCFGVLLFEMVAGQSPFYSANVPEMFNRIQHKEVKFPRHFSPELKDLVGRMLQKDPSRRLQSGTEFRKHAFFRGLDFDRVLRCEIVPEFVPGKDETSTS